jgi:hypothetical protein
VLPTPEKLSGCTVAADSEGISAPSEAASVPAEWSAEQREAYEERAAIMIVDAGLTPEEAYRQALECVRREFGI